MVYFRDTELNWSTLILFYCSFEINLSLLNLQLSQSHYLGKRDIQDNTIISCKLLFMVSWTKSWKWVVFQGTRQLYLELKCIQTRSASFLKFKHQVIFSYFGPKFLLATSFFSLMLPNFHTSNSQRESFHD